MEKNRFTPIFLIVVIAVLVGGLILGGNIANRSNSPVDLPKPELSEGQRGELGIDKNINETTIDAYLGRKDTVYRDLRMLEDPAAYEEIGGDRFLSGYVKGYEVVPYPYLANVVGLPEDVGQSYSGETLFTINEDGEYIANYKESMQILEDLFPKDKYIFLMCGGGGYSGMAKTMLVSLGWDADRIYDTGAYWSYEGANNVEVKQTDADGNVSYAFWKVPYHEIIFSELTKK